MVYSLHSLPSRNFSGEIRSPFQLSNHGLDLTGMELSNASLLDEGTAAAEAMSMIYEMRSKDQKKNASKLFVSEQVLPQTLAVLKN